MIGCLFLFGMNGSSRRLEMLYLERRKITPRRNGITTAQEKRPSPLVVQIRLAFPQT
jgi:hypothetical protein